MNDGYVTEYNKDRMVQLKDDLDTKISRYEELITNLTANVDNVGKYWISADPSSSQAYENLKNKYNSYKESLEDGKVLLDEFASGIDEQVQRYEEAENKINNIIDEN